MKQSLARLKQDIIRANQMAREANQISNEFMANTTYSVTLQIPAANLTPSKIKVAYILFRSVFLMFSSQWCYIS